MTGPRGTRAGSLPEGCFSIALPPPLCSPAADLQLTWMPYKGSFEIPVVVFFAFSLSLPLHWLTLCLPKSPQEQLKINKILFRSLSGSDLHKSLQKCCHAFLWHSWWHEVTSPISPPKTAACCTSFSLQLWRKLVEGIFQVSQLLLAHLSLQNCSFHSCSARALFLGDISNTSIAAPLFL